MADEITIKILDDGTLSVQTDSISDANHMSADKFLDQLADIMGGHRHTSKRKSFNEISVSRSPKRVAVSGYKD